MTDSVLVHPYIRALDTGGYAGGVMVGDHGQNRRECDHQHDRPAEARTCSETQLDNFVTRHHAFIPNQPPQDRSPDVTIAQTRPQPTGDIVYDIPLDADAPLLEPTPVKTKKLRTEVLETAESLINGDRDASYGDPTESFTRIAALWSATLDHEVTPAQVALCLTQLKIARLVASPTHRDSFVDGAAYLALGAEVASKTIAELV